MVLMSRARVAGLWLLLALLWSGASQVRAGPLMAVDFGGESIRVSIVKPGRTPIAVVLNEASKRKTSAQVAFVDSERLLGEDAALLGVRYPDRVYSRTRDLLGKRVDDKSLLKMLEMSRLPYKIVPHSKERPSAAIQTHAGKIYSAEELVASILHYARSITEAAAEGASVLDCVITVPAFWGQSQRQALVDAARVSGINVLALINTHAAAALQYGIERDFTNKTQLVVLYDMGATSTEAALVEYSSFRVKEVGTWKTYGQFEVKDVAWDAELGSENLDQILVDYFSEEFAAAHSGLDPRGSIKAVAKLKKQVKRTKEVLSANSFAPINVEELMDGHDLRSRIERADFEKLAGGFLERAAQPVRQILERNRVAVGDLTAVELLGGGSRVPAVKAALSQALEGRPLDMHLDADEAVVLGAGLFAANLSTTFRLRKFGMVDGITYPVAFQLEAPEAAAADPSQEGQFKPKALLPRMKRLPVRRNVPLPRIPSADSLTAKLFYNTSDPAVGLPPGAESDLLASFEISGIQEAASKHNDSGKLSLHVKADESGIVSLEKAEAAFEVTEEYTVKAPFENATSAGAPAAAPLAAEEASGNETDVNSTAPSPEPTYVDIVKTRKRTIRLPLRIGGSGFAFPPLTAEALQASKNVIKELAAAESARKEASKQKNELEAYVIAFRGRLDSDAEVITVTAEKERSGFLKRLDAAEDWLYSEGEQEPAAVFLAKSKELRVTGDAIDLRARELKALPKAVKAAQDFLKISRQAIGGWASTKPWLNATDIDALKAQADEFESWLSAETQKQAKRKAQEPPLLVSSTVNARVDAIRQSFNKLKSKKKPRPPPPPKGTKNETAAEESPPQQQPPEEGPEADGGSVEKETSSDHTEL